MVFSHQTVLLEEAIEGLAIKPNGFYIDGTFGRGGHSEAILAQLNEQGQLLAIDKDPEAIAAGQKKFANDPRVDFYHGSFADLKNITDSPQLNQLLFNKSVDGILLDLGVSSPQLDDASRGFSFQQDGPLDMRMNTSAGMSAAQWLNTAREEDIASVLWKYGEERFSRRIAHAITTARVEKALTRTSELVEIIKKAMPRFDPHKHPATRSFQAIRIFINRELQDLEDALQSALAILAIGGRLAVISFHSLEDRLVKQFMLTHAKGDEKLRKLPLSEEQLGIRLRLIGKAIKPSEMEQARNPRARSAILRIGEKYR